MKYLLWLFIPFLLFFSSCEDNNFIDFAAIAEEDELAIQAYLEEHQIEDAVRHESGMYYDIEQAGSGGSPSINSEIQVRYKGYLTDGTVFDETTGDDTRFFFLSQMIRGWQIGIPLLQKGGSGTLFIPSNLGYGFNGSGEIPGNSVIIFEVELVNFQ
jgi:FKBP-type peptidyl-prolyl cis-trans isomerase FkpA